MGVENAPLGNMGHVINKGWEFSVSYRNSAAQGKFNYNVWGTFSTNKGYVEDYGPQPIVMHKYPTFNGIQLFCFRSRTPMVLLLYLPHGRYLPLAGRDRPSYQ